MNGKGKRVVSYLHHSEQRNQNQRHRERPPDCRQAGGESNDEMGRLIQISSDPRSGSLARSSYIGLRPFDSAQGAGPFFFENMTLPLRPLS